MAILIKHLLKEEAISLKNLKILNKLIFTKKIKNKNLILKITNHKFRTQQAKKLFFILV